MPTSPTSGPGGSSGSGLPSQWTADGHGGVAATVDDVGSEPIAITGMTGQNAHLLDVLTINGAGLTVFKHGNIQVAPDPGQATNAKFYSASDGTGNIAQFLDGSTGVRGLTILPTGYLAIQLHAAPADADLAAGDCALWFDQTNGAGKLMVKAKTADGTVAAASIALA